jgi:hypothetical protein
MKSAETNLSYRFFFVKIITAHKVPYGSKKVAMKKTAWYIDNEERVFFCFILNFVFIVAKHVRTPLADRCLLVIKFKGIESRATFNLFDIDGYGLV